MSYYSKWHLMSEDESVMIRNPEGFYSWLEKLVAPHDFAGMRSMIRYGIFEDVTEETLREKVTKKNHYFSGFYSEGEYGGESINHFDPKDVNVLDFIGELSQFTDELMFLVENEGWPSLEPGLIYLVKAKDGQTVATQMHLVAVTQEE